MTAQTKTIDVHEIKSILRNAGVMHTGSRKRGDKEIRLTGSPSSVIIAFDVVDQERRTEVIRSSIAALEQAGCQVQGSPYEPDVFTIKR